jgi:hypothetical protein
MPSDSISTEQRNVLARECDRYAAHLTNRGAILDAADLFARCAIALRAAPEPRGWQPIETAPKDGTHILAWLPNFREYGGEPHVMTVKWTGPWTGWSIPGHGQLNPTYWMPQLSPPLTKGGDA